MGEYEVPQSLETLELTVIDNSKDRVLKNEDICMAKGESLSQIDNANKIKELRLCIPNMPKSKKGVIN